jgi:hypothetical protein
MIGQDGGVWVAVMTNKEPAGVPASFPFVVFLHQGPIYRYDSLFAGLLTPNSPAGIYIVQTLLKVGNTFVPIDEVEYNTADLVNSPFPTTTNYTALSNIYPLGLTSLVRVFMATNYDLEIKNTPPTEFRIPIPSRRSPPNIPFALTPPAGGYGLDLNNWAGGPITLKWRLFAPDGEVYDSNELPFPVPFFTDVMRFEPDNQLASITETPTNITAVRSGAPPPNTFGWHTYIRAAVFARPEGYKPVLQSMFYVLEDYSTNNIIQSHSEGHASLVINRSPFEFRQYTITLDKTSLPPGQYTLHVRHSVRKQGRPLPRRKRRLANVLYHLNHLPSGQLLHLL